MRVQPALRVEIKRRSHRADETITCPGDLLQLDTHRIMCGDATDPEVVQRVLEGESPNLMVTEPPYEINYTPTWKKRRGLSNLLTATWMLFPGDVCYVWHSSLEASKVEESLNASGFVCKSQIIWAKNLCEPSGSNYDWQHEPCWYAVRKDKAARWNWSLPESTLWTIPHIDSMESQEDEITGHFAQKPLECMARPIRFHSEKGDAVYEPFCGSGSSLIACELLGRKCLALELTPSFCDLIIRRWIRFRKRLGKEIA